jgi:hypothetical protein
MERKPNPSERKRNSTLADFLRYDEATRKLIRNLRELSVPGVDVFEAEYNLKLAEVGDALMRDTGSVSVEEARNLPMATEFGPEAAAVVLRLHHWVQEQLMIIRRPPS